MRTASLFRYVKKIEKLQLQVEELIYEKDKIAFQWAKAQEVRPQTPPFLSGYRFYLTDKTPRRTSTGKTYEALTERG